MSRLRILLLLIAFYVTLASFCSLLAVKPAFYGLSTVLGTTVLGSTVLGSTLLGTTSLIQVYADALVTGQLAISLMAVGMLVYQELSNPSYGKVPRVVGELRGSWLPLSGLLVLLFAFIVAFKILAILG